MQVIIIWHAQHQNGAEWKQDWLRPDSKNWLGRYKLCWMQMLKLPLGKLNFTGMMFTIKHSCYWKTIELFVFKTKTDVSSFRVNQIRWKNREINNIFSPKWVWTTDLPLPKPMHYQVSYPCWLSGRKLFVGHSTGFGGQVGVSKSQCKWLLSRLKIHT